MEAGSAEENVRPCTDCVRDQKDKSGYDQVVVPSEVPPKRPRPQPKESEERRDDGEGTDDDKDLTLPALDHGDESHRRKMATTKSTVLVVVDHAPGTCSLNSRAEYGVLC